MNEYAEEVKAIYDNVLAPPEAAVEETVTADESAAQAADESAANEPDTAAAAVTEDEPAEEAEESEEAPEEEVADEAADTSVAEPSTESESFQELLEEIPSDETLLARNPRISEQTKTELLQLADKARVRTAKLDTIGGEEGADIFAPVHELLTKPNRSVDDHRKALTSVFTTNPLATTELLAAGALDILFPVGDEPAIKEMARTGDFVLQTRFGEGATAEHIGQLLMLEKNGYFDVKDGLEYLNSEGNASQLFQTQAKTIETQETRLKELQHLVDNPHLIDQRSQQQSTAVKDLDEHLVNKFTEDLKPFRDKVRWGDDSELAKTTMNAILAELRSDPKYREAVEFAVQNGSLKVGDAIPHTVSQKIYSLLNQGKARFAERAAKINQELRSRSETSRNAKQAEKVVKETKPTPVATRTETHFDNGLIDPDVAALYRKAGASV